VPPCLRGFILLFFFVGAISPRPGLAATADGYRGIWFTLGQRSEFGDKYSGGLGTYTANHVPIAIYAPAVKKTFFVYGGTTAAAERHLLIMASYYDHERDRVPRPTIVHDKQGVNDPHDNAALAIDADGYLWIFISGRARARPGFLYRSSKPYDIDNFDRIDQREMTYPQPKYFPGHGFVYLFTKYTAGRELYWQASLDGRTWEPEQKLVGFGGHYQVSGSTADGRIIGTAFMWHPNGNVDARTNLYYLQTRDYGKTWTTISGGPITPPLDKPDNPALLIDYQSKKENVYIHDLVFDPQGDPAILYLTSRGAEPGPKSDPRTWHITHWTGSQWTTSDATTSDHDYDTGCLFINPRDDNHWEVFGPTDPGPQKWGAGGEMTTHISTDAGKTWKLDRHVTSNSKLNHSYARRVLSGVDPFAVLWADGDPNNLSESHLYFSTRAGDQVRELPYDMPAGPDAPPRRLLPSTRP
jgi:hypothetical protein